MDYDNIRSIGDIFGQNTSGDSSEGVSFTRRKDGKLYPNCDPSVWLRSCTKEIVNPIYGVVKGTIPKWINGSLLRNGPGSVKVGNTEFKHLFDSSALMHRFCISNGQVTYQCRFLQTDCYKRNKIANRIVVNEFGTSAAPDPCQSIFKKITAVFKQGEPSDNAMISIYPFGDEYYAFSEAPFIFKIDPVTLATEEKIRICDFIGVVNHTSHPHVMEDGTVYNLGMQVIKGTPQYCIICFPNGEYTFEDAYILGTIPARWRLHPSYMHTFGITENYFVIVEQPLSVSVPVMLRNQMLNQPLASCLRWYGDKHTLIHLLDRVTGRHLQTFKSDAFFYLHLINQYEVDKRYVVLDVCAYRDPSMLDCMYVDSMRNMQYNPGYAEMFRAKPLRFVLPINRPDMAVARKPRNLMRSRTLGNFMSKLSLGSGNMKRSKSNYNNVRYSSMDNLDETNNNVDQHLVNLVKLENSKAEAYLVADNNIHCVPELLCPLGCETPRINYERCCGKFYRYFYAISADVDSENPGTLIKVDLVKKTHVTWFETNCYPSEPVFLSSPEPKSEDDGVILSSIIWGNGDENHVGLLVLCARTWQELGRSEFYTDGPIPKCLHGWFVPEKHVSTDE